MSLAKSFGACTLTPSTISKNGLPRVIKADAGRKFHTTSFFIDSSGHSSVTLPLELKFASKEDLDLILSSGSIVPRPSNIVAEQDMEASTEDNDGSMTLETSFIGFEACSSSTDRSSKVVVVEAISILSTFVKDLVVSFETEVTVRAAEQDQVSKKSRDEAGSSSVMANIEITPVLTVKKEPKSETGYLGLSDLMALELGAIRDHMEMESTARVQETKLEPLSLDVTLTHAFTISVKSIQGTTLGETLVSLTIRHSNLHREVVTISNIAIHPGHSRYESVPDSNRRNVGSKYSVSKYLFHASKWMTSKSLTSFDGNSQHDQGSSMGLHTTDGIATSLDSEPVRCLLYSSCHERRRRNDESDLHITGFCDRDCWTNEVGHVIRIVSQSGGGGR